MLRRATAGVRLGLVLRGSAHRFERSESLRIAKGRDRSGNADGPLHDLSDYHLVDGSAAAETPKQKLWQRARERAHLRAQKLNDEMIQLHKEWEQLDSLSEKTN
eukprot:TRINITY_DN5779_c0_g1_i1.p1 TRINITY_DN5779_c0_g1~~TRINITY_DN5779_c0_g1_i1.p1  ORF type:complete len:104 (-),score=17.01 TRINITY_DN5779_c0_g1_i1:79-390(-)